MGCDTFIFLAVLEHEPYVYILIKIIKYNFCFVVLGFELRSHSASPFL
jgi:hypothetical protein